MSNGPHGGVFDPIYMFRRLILSDSWLSDRIAGQVFSPVFPEERPIFPCCTIDVITGTHNDYIPRETSQFLVRFWDQENSTHDATRELANQFKRRFNNSNMLAPVIPDEPASELFLNSDMSLGTSFWGVLTGIPNIPVAETGPPPVLFFDDDLAGIIESDVPLFRGTTYRVTVDIQGLLTPYSMTIMVKDNERGIDLYNYDQIDFQPTPAGFYDRVEFDFWVPTEGLTPDLDDAADIFIRLQFGNATTPLDMRLNRFSCMPNRGCIYHIRNTGTSQDLIDPDTNFRYTQTIYEMSHFTGHDPPVLSRVIGT